MSEGKYRLEVALEKAFNDIKSVKEPTYVSINQVVHRYGPVTMKQVREALEGSEGLEIAYLPAADGYLVLDMLVASIRMYMAQVIISRLQSSGDKKEKGDKIRQQVKEGK